MSKKDSLSVSEIVKKLVCIGLIFSFLSLSTPAAPETISVMAAKSWQEMRFQFLSSQLAIDAPNWVATLFSVSARTDETLRIARIRIYPGPVTVQKGQETVFTAVAFDNDNEPLSGIDFRWTTVDTANGRAGSRFLDSVFKADRVGTFLVKASAGGRDSEVRVVVTPQTGIRPPGTPTRSTSSRTGLGPVIATADTAGTKGGSAGFSNTKAQEKNEIQVENLLPGEGWDDGNWTSADDPGNQTGNPPGSPADDGAGNGNFQLSAPVVSLPGRGVDLALNLNYNSRVWNKAGSQVTYDIDRGNPAPGWSLGFGKIVFMGTQGGCMLIDADGTRHGYAGQISTWPTGMSFTGHTADGTFIDYGCNFTYGSHGSGWAKLPNGTTITYSTPGYATDQVYPTKLVDAQGNYISITYRNVGDGQIENITDTMGRIITFHYDSLNRLIYVRAPRMEGQTRSTARPKRAFW